MLTKEDLKVNHVYSAKRPQTIGFYRCFNDRMIIWMNGNSVQYDSPTVRQGQNYPTVSIEAFLKWADADVTKQTPDGDWRTDRN